MNDMIMLTAVFAAVLFHEAGHILCMKICSVPTKSVGFKFWGVKITADFSACSYKKELAVSLAGCFANLVLCALSCFKGTLFEASAVYLIFNMLPLEMLDGGEVLKLLLLIFGVNDKSVYRICRSLSLFVSLCIWVISAYLSLRGYSAYLLLTSVYFVASHFVKKNM